VADNAPVHAGCGDFEELVRKFGGELRFLPKYSPELSPIEAAFHSVKANLRRMSIRELAMVRGSTFLAMAMVPPGHFGKFYSACGYLVQDEGELLELCVAVAVALRLRS
jgi:hypothetical protein